MPRKANKTEVITIRVESKVKQELTKLAQLQRRELSDYLRLVLTDIIDKKITL
jgi:hypothetical protein